ncbi:MAG: Na/Pi cotransporter family protein [Bacteroidales bacterium]|nr:Na/Pi cotransporter family protein [Bacteroidales bacterium]MCF8343278.1 Na/Pi cotransporter family protein [Bacteroidales bacterium]MCF8350850.1 Na/Pi cotransporter family protein [Bacteroidales bacterium]MCF8375747.1 Na/Pi cotransporter family protein [Bacteroidales bacterium]MCF8400347.1 Na/Pi cotransporter family protein [Bacteroidales bacterium]
MEGLKLILNILTVIGSLGLFLFGMKMMSESLQKVAGSRMRSILAAIAGKPAKGVFTGLVVTAIIQSSSATTVMIVSFVNAGLLTLAESVGMIMGANIGTTITPWLISLLGFGQTFNIGVILLPLIALSLPLLFSSDWRKKSWAEFIMGFVILFLGLGLLKSNVPAVEQGTYFFEHFSTYTSATFFDILLFVGIGMILTIIFQSSSATIALTFVIATEGWISFPLATAMVLGENIGTTSTAVIASLVANTPAKRSALIHVIFNAIGVFWALLVFRYLLLGTDFFVNKIDGVSASDNPLAIPLALSIFHTGFNVINTLILVNFVPFIVLLSRKILPGGDKADEDYKLRFIDSTVLSTSELSLFQAKKEVKHLALRVRQMYEIIPRLLLEKRPRKYDKLFKVIGKNEDLVDTMEIEIAKYLTKLSDGKLSDQSTRQVRALFKIIDDLESIGDACNSISKIIDIKNRENAYFVQDLRDNLNELFEAVDHAFEIMFENLEKDKSNIDLGKARQAEDHINSLRNKLREEHIANINKGKYPYQTGTYYSELFTSLEKIGDYIINVSEALKEI